jgi:4-amino-4-deoxy-L-arabinose transferase-like glycosyltransferase
MLLGVLFRLDHSGRLAEIVQWLLSMGILQLVWLIARSLYGNRTAVIALLLTAFYLPLIHYAGLFLSENPFTFCLLLSFWLLLKSIDSRDARQAWAFGLLCGLSTGLAAAFKATILLPALLTAAVYGIHALRNRLASAAVPLIAAAIGAAVMFVPLASRCTRLAEGHSCLVSTNGPMNILMGHFGEKAGFYWHDHRRNLEYSFTSPGATLRHYAGRVDLEFGAYDAAANLDLARRWIAQHPREAILLSLRNLGDLFSSRTVWPSARIRGVDAVAGALLGFQILVLLPALTLLVLRAKAMIRFRPAALPECLLLMPVLGLCATVFMTITEVRFRVPFDAFLIILAARAYVGLIPDGVLHRWNPSIRQPQPPMPSPTPSLLQDGN